MLDDVVKAARKREALALVAVVAIVVVALTTAPASGGTSLPAKVKYVRGPDTALAAPVFLEAEQVDPAVCPRGWQVVGGGVFGNLPVVASRMVQSYASNVDGSAPGRRGWTSWVVVGCAPTCAADPVANSVAICVQNAVPSGTWP